MLCPRFESIALLSRGIVRTPNVDIVLAALTDRVIPPGGRQHTAAAIAGWGHKPTARRARALARRTGRPYIALEDGFFRSVGLGLDNAPPLSLVADDLGVYYDSREPGRIAWALTGGVAAEAADSARADAIVRLIREKRLTKYNTADPDAPLPETRHGAAPVLAIDQTWRDAGLIGAGAADDSFDRMLDAALDENPGADIWLKIHPDVVAGKRRGCVDLSRLPDRVRLVSQNICPWRLFERVERVYTVSSQTGFEALLAGKEVRCFAMPFYAGWGLTRDDAPPSEGREAVTLGRLVDAAVLRYPAYVDPYSATLCEPERALDILAFIRDRRREHTGPKVFLGIDRWKREGLQAFTGGGTKDVFVTSPDRAVAEARKAGAPVYAWAGAIKNGLSADCAREGVPLVRVEDGFLRSSGLWLGLMPSCSLAFDPDGIYFDGTAPSRLEAILNQRDFTPEELARAAEIRRRIVSGGLTKYNVGAPAEIAAPAGKRVLLVAAQVEDDASIRLSAPDIKTNLGLLQAVRGRAPDAYIVFKPHPDVETGLRPGAVPRAEALALADEIADNASASALLEVVDEVHTLTSLLGFEALLRGRKVATYGLPFYAGWGLTDDRLSFPRRRQGLTLDELVAGALLRYCAYVDPVSQQPCPPEVLIDRLSEGLSFPVRTGLRNAVVRAFYGRLAPPVMRLYRRAVEAAGV